MSGDDESVWVVLVVVSWMRLKIDVDDGWSVVLMTGGCWSWWKVVYIYIYIKELVRFLRGWLVDIVGLLWGVWNLKQNEKKKKKKIKKKNKNKKENKNKKRKRKKKKEKKKNKKKKKEFVTVWRGTFVTVWRGAFVTVWRGAFVTVWRGAFVTVLRGAFVTVWRGAFVTVLTGTFRVPNELFIKV